MARRTASRRYLRAGAGAWPWLGCWCGRGSYDGGVVDRADVVAELVALPWNGTGLIGVPDAALD